MNSTGILNNKTLSSIDHFIGMAIKNEMSWNTLAMVLKEMMTSVEKSHQVIEVMLEILQSMSKKESHDFEATEGNMEPNEPVNEQIIEIKQDIPFERNLKKIENVVTKDFKACHECGEMFFNEFALSKHMKTHSDCNETIKKLIKSGEKLYTFVGSFDITHVNEESSSKEIVFHKANIDTKTQQSAIKKDKKIKHKCKICRKSFSQKSYLKSHEVIHTGEVPFQCKTCKKRFKRRSNLSAHEKRHSNERSFRCKSCKYKACTKANLEHHERIHTGERPFKCNTCQKRFTQSQALTVHIRIHTGERPYKCVSCAEYFISNSRLRLHERRTHKEILNKKELK